MYTKAQFSDQFYIFFSTTFSSLYQRHQFITIKTLLPIFESECEAAISWLLNNKMIVNPDKFQVILLEKRSSDNTNIELKIGNEKIKST